MNIILSTILLILSSRYLYLWSFHAEERLHMNSKKGKKMRKKTIFMPPYILLGLYDKNPVFVVWINRMAGTLSVFFSLIMLLAAIFGPLKLH